ncbi:MAG: PQQ-binding-like beta-propeller repeat protein [Gammaproteobacteria bacterium]
MKSRIFQSFVVIAWASGLGLAPPAEAVAAAPAPAAASTAEVPAAELYKTRCAACHEGGVARAPHSLKFQMLGPETVLRALSGGVMAPMATGLSDADKRRLAEFLGGRALGGGGTQPPKVCAAAQSRFDLDRPARSTGWGVDAHNTRFVPPDMAGLKAADLPRLQLKWAFAFPGATRARSQPTIAGGAAFVGSQDGTVYALDLASGCVRWSFKADNEVRASPVVETWRAGDTEAKPRVWFGDLDGNAYALEAFTGRLLWKVRVDTHPCLTITGSPRMAEGRLYVPMSSNEWAAAADPTYECCSFRGGVAALDAATGKRLWITYSIADTPQPTGERNSAGAARIGPAGAPVWNSPTIDLQRRRLYVGTGEAYTSPAADTSDAVLALDLDTGKRLWHYQSISGDAWNLACFIGGGPNCPIENGPDLDIGASPILFRLPDGRDTLLVGQKSAHVFALDPDTGALRWRIKEGRGGYAGGVHWGMATDATTLYAPNADTIFLGTEKGEAKPGLFAIDPVDGRVKWFAPAPLVCREEQKPACDPGYSAPVTAIEGAVFAPGFDGHLRIHDITGKLVWSFDTAREFTTVSGEKARGGSIESAGAMVADGHVLVNSGYLFGGRMPGNVLLAFTVDGK